MARFTTLSAVALSLGLIGSACTSGGSAADAGSIDPDACPAIYIPAVFGTITDQNGAPLVPDQIEALAEGQWQPCGLHQDVDVSYDCSDWPTGVTIDEQAAQTYTVRVTLDAQSWDFEVQVQRANNCNVESEELNLVLPPL